MTEFILVVLLISPLQQVGEYHISNEILSYQKPVSGPDLIVRPGF